MRGHGVTIGVALIAVGVPLALIRDTDTWGKSITALGVLILAWALVAERRAGRRQQGAQRRDADEQAWRARLFQSGDVLLFKFHTLSAIHGPLHPSFAPVRAMRAKTDSAELTAWADEAEKFLAIYHPAHLVAFRVAPKGFGLPENRIEGFLYVLSQLPN